jgi:hypothetical protein
MKKFQSFVVLIFACTLALTFASAVRAGDIAACDTSQVTGTVVAVDETTGTVTVDTGGGALCNVTLNGSYDHPIASLLGKYFGDISAEALANALSSTQGCALVSGGSGTWTSCDTPGVTTVQVISDNGDGTFTAQITNPDGTITTIILTVEDAAAAENISQALAQLAVDWTLDENGDLVQVSDQVMAYHEQGIGFGVLVKLYSLSNASGIPVADLLAQFQSGVGIGELFKLYGGKPPLNGVGHVKQELKATPQPTEAAGQTNNGNHNGQNNGNGNGNNGNGNGNGNGNDKPKNPKK